MAPPILARSVRAVAHALGARGGARARPAPRAPHHRAVPLLDRAVSTSARTGRFAVLTTRR
ncbi:hypothetical protein ACF06X_31005 [Streptomyces sp. NPDC015346]|uniref:hypothetical protein n=1 Tax=Streptomyces sp. NPDC015346 TaxID=3364954 RepID=UPI0036FD5FAC